MEAHRIELWQRAMAVFVDALEREAGSREELISACCEGDTELRQAVDTLLRADGETRGDLPDLGRAMGVSAPEREWKGVELGNHRIVRRLGAGGMGVVFLGERSDGAFEQRVAIKVLRPGTLTAPVRVRFERERSILARLEHPAIARLIDGGETASGEPFLTMEYVDGDPIDAYCQAHGLSIRDRLDLFQRVCSGVEYAHRNLTVHRDLKPSNILVSADGAPRIVDFGIAKLLDPTAGSATVTEAHTPDYASPEQLLGLEPTTATDVYSLGVVLYELLAGRRPARAAVEGTRKTLEAPPPPPSAAIGPGAKPETDLDHVVLKALEFEPERRYRSVESLSDDIERFLEGRPVSAQPDRWSYRLRKFVRRNAVAVGASVLAVALLAAYVTTALVQARQVRQERDTAEAVTEFLVTSYERVDPTRSRGERISAREVLDDSARRIENELTDEPEVKARLLSSLGQVYLSLGLLDQAEPLISRAVALRRDSRGDPEQLASTLLQESTVLQARGSYDAALERIAEARALRGGRRDAFEAQTLRQEAELRFVLGEREDGLTLERAALALERELFGSGHLRVLEAQARLASKLRAQREDEEADALERAVFAALPELGLGVHPFVAEMTSRIGSTARRQNRHGEAAVRLEEALAMQRELYGEEHASIASNLNSLGWVRWDQDRAEEATELFRQVLAMEERLFGADNPRIAPRAYNLGLLLQREFGRVGEAEALFRRALEVRAAALGEKSWSTPNTALFQIAHGEALFSLGRYEEAQATVDSILPVWKAYEVYDRRNGCQTRSLLAALQMRRGELGEAAEHLEFCYPVLMEHLDPDHKSVLLAKERLVAALTATGRGAEAGHLQAAGGDSAL